MKKNSRLNNISRALYASLILLSPLANANANTLGADSIYSFTPVGEAADNVIRQAVYNSVDNNVTYQYNQINLTNPKTGGSNVFGSGSYSKNFTVEGMNVVANWSNPDYANKTGTTSGGVIRTAGNWSESINGTFVNNAVTGSAKGGAIRVQTVNGGNGSINGDFIGNNVHGTSAYPTSGAILFENYTGGMRVKNISGNFVGNYVTSTGTQTQHATSGGAIQFGSGAATKYAETGSITANFIGNHASSSVYSQGGAFDNGQYSKLGDITGDFIRNYSHANTSNTRGAQGGAIYTFATSELGNITGDFIENYAKGEGVGAGAGGAMYIMARTPVGNIKGNFYSNYAQGVSSAEGGVIFNFGQLSDFGTKDSIFNNNHIITTGTSGSIIARGSVISNSFDDRTGAAFNPNGLGASIKNISGTFTGNYIDAAKGRAEGGVIYNHAKSSIGSITDAVFEGSSVNAINTKGGVLYNDGTITNGISNSKFLGNTSGAGDGGVIYNTGTIAGISNTNFDKNNTNAGNGGVIYNTGTITEISGTHFTKNATDGGVLYNTGNITNGISNSEFIGNQTGSGNGGVIYNTGNLPVIANTVFRNNTLTGGLGGAIYTTKDIILRDNVVFLNNSAGSGNDIYLANGANLTIQNTDDNYYDTTSTGGIASQNNSSKIIVDEGAHLTLSGDDTGFSGTTVAKNNSTLSFIKADSVTDIQLDGKDSYVSYDWIEKDKSANISAADNSNTAIIKNGNGKLTFNGDVSKADANVTVSSGVLEHIGQYFKSGTNSINKSAELIINNSNNILTKITSGAFGSGTFTKKGSGNITLDGQNSNFRGNVNINEGKISYTSGEDKSFLNAETYNIQENGTLELTNNGTDNIELNNLTGEGSIEKSGNAQLSFTSDKIGSENGFTGSLDLNGGNTVANVGAQNTEGQFDFTANVGADTSLEYKNASTDSFTLNDSAKISFKEGASGSNIKFNGADFTIENDVKNAQGNTISMGEGSSVDITGSSYAGNYSVLDGSYVNISAKSDTEFTGNIAIKNSSVNLQNDAITNTNFQNLDLGTSTDLRLDLAFGDNIIADTITAQSAGGRLKLTDVNVISANRVDRNILNDTVKVLTGVEFTDDEYSRLISNDNLAYDYTLTKISPDSLKLTSSLKDNSLYIMNHLRDSERTFTWNTDDNALYKAATRESDNTIGQTLEGTLHILGRTQDRADTIDAAGLSLFDLSSETNLDMQNVTIKNAAGKNGSAVNVTSDDASANINNVLFLGNDSAVFVGNSAGTTEGKEIVISNSKFQNNSLAEDSKGSAIHNEGKLTLNDVEFSGNANNYIYNKGELNINATKEETAKLVNGTGGNITNDGTINLKSNDDIVFDIANPISKSDKSDVNGKIFTNGTYQIGGKLTNQDITSFGKTIISGGLQNSNWTIADGASGTLSSDVTGGSVINNSILNIINPVSISGEILSDTAAVINYTGSGALNITGNADNYKGIFNINDPAMSRKEGIVTFTERNNINNFFSANTQINNYSGVLNYNTDKTNIKLSQDGNFAKINLTDGATFNMTGLNDGKYTIADGWLTTTGTNNISLANGEYLFNSTLPQTDNTITVSNAVFGFNDIDGTPNGNLNGYDFNIGNNYVLKDGSTLDLLMHTHNSASGDNRAHYAGDNYIFNSFNSIGDNNNISLDLNLYADISTPRYPITDTITANSGSGILNLIKVGIRDDNGGIFTYNKPLRVIYGNNNLQIATENNIEVLSWATNVYKYKFSSATSLGVEGLEDEYSHTADSINVEMGGFASSETLRDLNRFNINLSGDNQGGNRGFSFVEDQAYHIYRDLDETTKGHFVIVGKSNKTPNGGIISGKFNQLRFESTTETDRFFEKDGKYYYTEYLKGIEEAVPREVEVHIETIDGKDYYVINASEFTEGRDKGSMFVLINDTEFDMTDITLTETLRAGVKPIKDGSAIYADNDNAKAKLTNVNFENNKVTAGNGGAIANINSSEFILKNSKITDNYAFGNGGAIYNTSKGMILENLTADNSSADGLGGVIYTNADLTIRNSNFGTTTLNKHKDGVSNDIYIDGNATVKFETNDIPATDNTPFISGNSIIKSGIAGSGNFVKDGNAKLILSGVNSDFAGHFEIAHGSVDYIQTVTDGFVNGSVKLSKNTSLNINNENSDHIQNLSGEGNLNKNGEGELTLTGGNSDFKGNIDIAEGILNYNQNTENGFVSGAVKLAQNTSLNINNENSDHIQNLSGKGSLNKNGGGELTLTGDNSGFEGNAEIQEGSLTYVYNPDSSDKYFGGNTILDNATLNVDVVSGSTEIKNISSKNSNSGIIVKKGSGKAELTGNNSRFTGKTDIEAGTLAYSNSKGQFVKGDVNIKERAELEFTTNSDDSITNKIGGLGKFVKKGLNKLTLNNDNSEFNGTVDITSGTLAYSDAADNTKFFGNNTDYNVNGEFDIDNRNDVQIQNLSGAGTIVKTETGTLNLGGDNSKYTGSIKIDDGDLSFVDDDSSEYISGATELSKDAALNYTANKTASLENVSGNGTLNYNGSQTLTFDANKNNFTGHAITDGTLLDVTGKNTTSADFKMTVNSGKLNYTAANGANILIDDKFSFSEANNSTIQFNNAVFTLNDEIANSDKNNIIFNDTTVAFNNEKYEQGTYSVKNSIIDLTKDNHETFLREFNSLTIGEDTGLKVDVNLLLRDNAKDAKIDTLKVNNSDAGTIKVALTQFIINDKKSDDGLGKTYTLNVLDGLTFDEDRSIERWSTQAYTYDVKTKGTDVELTAVKASDGNSLGEMNRLDGTRGFNFNYTEEDDTTYTVTSNLGNTNSGEFTVIGDKNRGTTVSGDNKYSMFNVTKESNLTVSDLTIKDAKASNRGGSVVSSNNENANILLENVNIQSNTSTGNGGAVENISSKDFQIINGNFDGNKSFGNGGAIYTASDMYIFDTDFSNNTEKNGKNDIYISGKNTNITYEISEGISGNIAGGLGGDGIFNKTGSGSLTLSGRNSGFNGTLNILDGSKVTFSQTDADDSYISGITNIYDNGKLILNNDKSDINIGTVKGSTNTSIDITGGQKVILARDNSGFSGDLNIQKGAAVFNSQSASDKYISGKTNISKDASLNLYNTNDFYLNDKINGEGSLIKSGNGRLLVDGTSSLNGELAITQGELAFRQNSSLGNLNALRFENATTLNLQNTLVINNGDGTYTTNPNPASLENVYIKTIVLNGKTNLKLDVDLQNVKADKIGSEFVQGNGQFIINNAGVNVLSDSLLKDTSVEIAYGALAQGDRIALEKNFDTVMGPIQKYSISYADGYLDFSRMGGTTPTYDIVNPSVMATPIAAQTGGYLTQLETLQSGFYHIDRYMKYPKNKRFAAEQSNRYAITETPAYSKSPLPETSQSMWVKPFVSIENVGLQGGPNVNLTTYGSLYGGDSDLVDLKHGFKGVISTFVGYNGSRQSYSNVNMNQNGGTLGITGTLYKNNFFTGLTISTGASAGDADTMFGHDEFAMLTAGIANKTGYNFEFNEGKFIIQPSLFLGYTFVNTFDYRNKANVSINSDPLHAISIMPGVKFIGNLNNNTQIYAGTDVVMNILGDTNVKANDVTLPQLSVKPYVQYGVGIQKMWSDRFTAFFQTMVRNGGRNGVAFSAGMRWTIGKAPKKKDNSIVPVKHTLKEKKKNR